MPTKQPIRGISSGVQNNESGNRPENTDCPECGGSFTQDGKGEYFCPDCGLVPDYTQTQSQHGWTRRDDGSITNTQRGGSLTNCRHDKGLTTEIGWVDADATGADLSDTQKHRANRLRKYHKQTKCDGREQSISRGFSEIGRMATSLGLADQVKEASCMMFKQASKLNIIYGRSIEGVASGAVFLGSKIHHTPRTMSEIETVSRVGYTRIQRAQNVLRSELDISIPLAEAKRHVPRFHSEVEFADEILPAAKELADNFHNSVASGSTTPKTIAITALYVEQLKSGRYIDQTTLEEDLPISARSINGTYRDLLKFDPDVDIAPEKIDELNANELSDQL